MNYERTYQKKRLVKRIKFLEFQLQQQKRHFLDTLSDAQEVCSSNIEKLTKKYESDKRLMSRAIHDLMKMTKQDFIPMYKVGDKVKVLDTEFVTGNGIGTVKWSSGDNYGVELFGFGEVYVAIYCGAHLRLIEEAK